MSRGLMGAGTAMIERLQAQVKQKDGEIGLLQVWKRLRVTFDKFMLAISL